LQFRPEVPVNRDRTTAHSVRQNGEFHLRDLRGCSNGVRWSTPEWRTRASMYPQGPDSSCEAWEEQLYLADRIKFPPGSGLNHGKDAER
jgi:hypothetical protein